MLVLILTGDSDSTFYFRPSLRSVFTIKLYIFPQTTALHIWFFWNCGLSNEFQIQLYGLEQYLAAQYEFIILDTLVGLSALKSMLLCATWA